MRQLYLITFASGKQKGSISERHKELLGLLNTQYEVNLVNIRNVDQIPGDALKLIFITGRYVEQEIVMHYEELPHPLFLLTDGYNNSLSAVMEIKAWANSQSIKCTILYSEDERILGEIDTIYRVYTALCRMKGKKIGVIGTPANWLISSSVNYLLAQRRWGVEYTDIPIDELVAEFGSTPDDAVGEMAAEIAGRARMCIEATPDDLLRDMRVYKALRTVIDRYGLSALTINNNKMIDDIGASTCVALSLLNDEGIPACGESDLQSVFTSLAVKELTGEMAFMGNVSAIDTRANAVVLSYCSVGTDFVGGDYTIRSHYESGESVAIEGHIPSGCRVTMVKCGGESLDEYFVASGVTLDNDYKELRCRTQIKVGLDTPVSYFIDNSIGNHHLLVKGDHEELVKAFFEYSASRKRNISWQDYEI